MTISKNIAFYTFGKNYINYLNDIINKLNNDHGYIVYFVDNYFQSSLNYLNLPIKLNDQLYFVSTEEEPTTESVNTFTDRIKNENQNNPCCIVGVGGGCTLDTAKAVSNLLGNNGRAEDYQGWDLLKFPGVYKIGIPTISGTGAEASRTCVLKNEAKNLKLGMNSEYTMFDQLILDPELPKTVPDDQYFYTGMDTFIHCIESLNGSYRHPLADAYSNEALRLVSEVFNSNEMKNDKNREKLMVASYLGGCALANSYVGVVHPFSAGLSMTLGTHHCLANCLVMNVLEEFYPKETYQFHGFLEKQRIKLPSNITSNLFEDQFNQLYDSTIIHEKPLVNALGNNFKNILNKVKVREIFSRI